MKTYIVRTQFIFEGNFFIKAASKTEAEKAVKQDCHFLMGGNIHATLNSDRMDSMNYEFPVHPDKKILSAKLNQQKPASQNTGCGLNRHRP
ncbi:hypothetical protein OH491_24340 [Termitidicoccus mucosus]|uniref:hypothetical protein n=1 Tax=Termitidicoccus mucosus TaxID=1184151 RepID=UPI000838FD07